jgi:hypothetical protein
MPMMSGASIRCEGRDMLRKTQWILLTTISPIVFSALVGCGQMYWSDSITGFVVDAATKSPLPGVNVVVHWDVYGGLEGGNYEGNVNVMETETDQAGRFSFPSWGPKWSGGMVRTSNPWLHFFKSGFKTEIRSNNDPRMGEWTGTMRSDWTGKTIGLESMDPSRAEYAKWLEFLSDSLQSIGREYGGRCDWEKLTHVIVALEREYRILEKTGVIASHKNNVYRHLISNDSSVARQCSAAPTALLRGVE